jgi:hypothetical protein
VNKITLECIPHHEQRYDTVGDWYFDADKNLIIRVSNMGNWKYETLVAIHELIEVTLCAMGNITQEKVDAFDLKYDGDGEPGDEPNCPYRGPHCIATGIERILAAVMGIGWIQYEEAIADLPDWKSTHKAMLHGG